MKPRTSGERKLLIGVEVLALLLSQDIVWTIISAILAFFTKYSQTAFRDKHALVFFTIQIIFGFVYMFLTVFSVNDSNKAVSDIFNRPIPKKILDVCATGLLKIYYVWEKIEDRSCGNVDHRE